MYFSGLLLNGFYFLLLVVFVAWTPIGPPRPVARWVVSGGSSLTVNGSTNLNKFSCEINAYHRLDTLEITETRTAVALTGSLQLDLRNFDCHHPVMTRDLRKTLKADQFPVLCINFLSLNKMPSLRQTPEAITGWVDIELAGARKRVEVHYQLSEDAQGMVHLIGKRDVTFADFNLTPPSKFKGMVQTHQKLTIAFHLKIRAVI